MRMLAILFGGLAHSLAKRSLAELRPGIGPDLPVPPARLRRNIRFGPSASEYSAAQSAAANTSETPGFPSAIARVAFRHAYARTDLLAAAVAIFRRVPHPLHRRWFPAVRDG